MAQHDIEPLLQPHEIVRDPVHRDIRITALERAIIDTETFQRLRFIQQLGPVSLVYPGASHTRFIHSIGTVHAFDSLVMIVNNNAALIGEPLCSLSSYERLLGRLYALVHDVAHIPYGHTLEDEGNLLPPEWDDNERADHWMGEKAEIPREIRSFLSDVESEDLADDLISDLRALLVGAPDHQSLKHSAIADLVGNTICADLIDYLDRDMYYCGLRERAGDRVLQYLAILPLAVTSDRKEAYSSDEEEDRPKEWRVDAENGRPRVALLAYRSERDHRQGLPGRMVPKDEILSEAIDLLRRRFTLAEKVYFHRTKLASAAMIISAATSAEIKPADMYKRTDETFVHALMQVKDERARKLAKDFRTRRLFAAIYRLDFRPEKADAQSIAFWREHYPRWRDAKWRAKQERWLEETAGLRPGSVAIYCPDRKMNLKEFKLLVQSRPHGEVRELRSLLLLDPVRQAEMDAINKRYAHLWKLLVFVDRDALDPRTATQKEKDFSRLCEELFGFENDLAPELRGTGRPLEEQLTDREIALYQEETGTSVPHDIAREVAGTFHRGQPDLREAIRRELRSRMGKDGKGA